MERNKHKTQSNKHKMESDNDKLESEKSKMESMYKTQSERFILLRMEQCDECH